jgi:hypothetical protein
MMEVVFLFRDNKLDLRSFISKKNLIFHFSETHYSFYLKDYLLRVVISYQEDQDYLYLTTSIYELASEGINNEVLVDKQINPLHVAKFKEFDVFQDLYRNRQITGSMGLRTAEDICDCICSVLKILAKTDDLICFV